MDIRRVDRELVPATRPSAHGPRVEQKRRAAERLGEQHPGGHGSDISREREEGALPSPSCPAAGTPEPEAHIIDVLA